LDVVNCTALNNRATHGRFLCCEADPPHTIAGRVWISNSVIADGSNEVTTDDAKIWLDHSLLSIEPGSIIDPGNNVTFGPGNISGDPCAVDPGYWDTSGTVDDANDDFFVVGDYHLKSQAGRWLTDEGQWVTDEMTSPCIDAGDPMSAIGIEPFPNGGRVNMGAYGGTAEASKSWFGGPVCETIVAGDINGDCRVDFADLAILARQWMREFPTPMDDER